MEPAQTISESIYLKKINKLQEDIIELQKKNNRKKSNNRKG